MGVKKKCLQCGKGFDAKTKAQKYCSPECGRKFREGKKDKKPHGRPTVVTEDKKREILAVLTAGGSRNTASDYVGVDKASLHRAVESDEAFSQQVKKAESKAQLRHLKTIGNASDDGVWQASAWMLERKWPEQFGRNRTEQPKQHEKQTIEIVRLKGKRDAG